MSEEGPTGPWADALPVADPPIDDADDLVIDDAVDLVIDDAVDLVIDDAVDPPLEVETSTGGLLSVVRAVALEVELLTAATNGFPTLLSDHLASVEDVVKRTSSGQTDLFEDYRRSIDEGIADLRRLVVEDDAELRRVVGANDSDIARIVARVGDLPSTVVTTEMMNQVASDVGAALAANETSLSATRQELAVLGERLAARLDRLEEATATAPQDDDTNLALNDLSVVVSDVRDVVDVHAVAAQANAIAMAELMRIARELRASTEAQAVRARVDAAVLVEVVDRVRALQQGAPEPEGGRESVALLTDVADALRDLQHAIPEPVRTDHTAAAAMAELTGLVRGLQDTVDDLAAAEPAPAPSVRDTAALDQVVVAVRAMQVAVVSEVSELRDDVLKLKRRVALRTPASEPAGGLGDAEIERIVTEVVTRLEASFEVLPNDEPEPPPPRRPARRPATGTGSRGRTA